MIIKGVNLQDKNKEQNCLLNFSRYDSHHVYLWSIGKYKGFTVCATYDTLQSRVKDHSAATLFPILKHIF